MRVIAGKARGLKLISPAGEETRPTLDRVKEAVFSMILPIIIDSVVLDLFAGSGALGIESLSRGAKKAYFIDNSDKAIACITANLANTKFQEESVIQKTTAERFLNETNEKFDLIFLDPPYASEKYADILAQIQENKILTDDGIIVVEWDVQLGFPSELRCFKTKKEKIYGRVGITILEYTDSL